MCASSGPKENIISSFPARRRVQPQNPDPRDHDAHSPAGRLFVEMIDEVMRLNGRLVAAARRNTEVAGLRPPHWIILSAIVCAPEPPTVPRIGRALGHSRQAVQRVADHLVAEGLADWIDNPDHARAKRLVPTERGISTYAQADRESASWADRVVEDIRMEELRTLITFLRRVRLSLEDDAKR